MAAAAAIAAIGLGVWYGAGRVAPGEAVAAAGAETQPRRQVAAPAPPPRVPSAPEARADGAGDGLRRVPIPEVDERAPAWLSMAQARESGDSRTPPIQREAPAERPDPALLADHEAYAAHQLAQKQRLAAAYAQAAGPEIARLQADLEQGRAAGIAPEELARVAEKIRRIERQRQAAEAMLSKGKEQ
jgi:hypothetical protein